MLENRVAAGRAALLAAEAPPLNKNPKSLPQGADPLIASGVVRQLLGNCSTMTLYRLEQNPDLDFPEADVVINRRKLWRLSRIDSWISKLSNKSKTEKAG